MTDERIDTLYTLARRSGAIGGKLVGAGGGGFLLVYAPRPEDTPSGDGRGAAPPSCPSTSSSRALSEPNTRDAAARRHRRLRPDRPQARRRRWTATSWSAATTWRSTPPRRWPPSTARTAVRDARRRCWRCAPTSSSSPSPTTACAAERRGARGRRARPGREARRASAVAEVDTDRRRGQRGRPARQGRLQPPLPPRHRPRDHRGALRASSATSCTSAAATATAAGSAMTRNGAPTVQRSGGGEIVDQGMHLLDLSHWLLGPLPLHSALLRTQFWDTAGRRQRGADPRRARLAHRAVGAAARQLDRVEEPLLAGDLLPHGQAARRGPRALLRSAEAADLQDEARARAARGRGARLPRPRTARGWRSGATSARRSPAARRCSAAWKTHALRGRPSTPPTRPTAMGRSGRAWDERHGHALDRRPGLQRGGHGPHLLRADRGGPRPHRLRLGDRLRAGPVHRPHRGDHPRAARARRARQAAALLAALRPAGGDARGAGRLHRRCRRRHRRRPAGPAGADHGHDRALARGLRGRLRAAPHARGRDAAQADRRRRGLSHHQAGRRGRHPAQHRRLPADEPARRRPRRRAQRGPRLPARPGRAGRLPPDEHPL